MRFLLLALLLIGSLAVVDGGAVPCDVIQGQPQCYVTMRPGPTRDVLSVTSIDGELEERAEDAGELLLTTVSIQDRLSWIEFVRNSLDERVRNLDRELIYPSDVAREDIQQRNSVAMDTSELDATIAGLSAAGLDLSGAYEGAEIVDVTTDGAVTADELLIGDVVTRVGDVPVHTSAEAVAEVRLLSPGDRVELAITRAGQELVVVLTAATNPQDDTLAYLGVMLLTKIDLPVDVDIDAGNIGGPSAGMMFALGIVDLLTDVDLTGGSVIAGTGTITIDGIVGPIGGIQQKVVAASSLRRPAELFLVPRANFVEAQGAAVGREITLVPIDNLQDSVRVLEQFRAGQMPDEAIALGP